MAIGTRIIEPLYSVDRGVAVALAEAGLDAMGQFCEDGRLTSEARLLIEDQRAALEMVMDVVGGPARAHQPVHPGATAAD